MSQKYDVKEAFVPSTQRNAQRRLKAYRAS
jgi:hypothetical protein